MEISKDKNGSTLVVSPAGRLDTASAPQLEAELNASIGDVTELILDLAKLEYMSSAGLRIILSAQKTMNKQGSMIVRNASELVRSVFDITGMDSVINMAD